MESEKMEAVEETEEKLIPDEKMVVLDEVAEAETEEVEEVAETTEETSPDNDQEAVEEKMEEEVKKRSAETVEEEEEPPLKKNKPDDDKDEVEKMEEAETEKVEDESEKKEEESKNEEPKEENETKRASREGSEEKGPKRSPELVKFWKAVEEDPSDFTGWTYLLQYVDAHAEREDGREAYDKFLFRYPYCYGYWKKYADFEKRKGTRETCLAVFERGVKAIPLSADLWIHFMNYVKVEFADQEEAVREAYERAVTACGREFRSDKLWDHYVKWELSLQEEQTETKDLRKVLNLYDKILLNPTQGLNHQFEMFREFVKDNNPKDMLEITDFLTLRKEILLAMAGNDKEDEEKKEKTEEEETASEAVDDGVPPPGEGDSGARADEEILAMKEKIIHSRRKIFKETEAKVQLRYKFEENIKRPYVHIKPLERGQLKNWNEYLDFEMKQDDPSLVEILFERCLISCALYEEFWLKYSEYMIERTRNETDEKVKENLVAKTRDIFTRACTHHLTTKVDLHLAWSAFEETNQHFDAAIEVLQKIEREHPKLMSLMSRRINAERRRGNLEAVHTLYKDYIENAKSTVRSDWAIKYSRFLRLKCDDEATAIQVLEDAILVDEKNPKLYLQMLDVYMHHRPLNETKIIEIFDKALTTEKGKTLNEKHRLLFSQRKSEFLEEFGSNISELLAAQTAHAKLNVELKPAVVGGKDESQHHGGSNPIKTVDSTYRSDRPSNGSTATTYPATNSSSYTAHHNTQYQQYGSRYGYQGQQYQYPPNYYQGYNY